MVLVYHIIDAKDYQLLLSKLTSCNAVGRSYLRLFELFEWLRPLLF